MYQGQIDTISNRADWIAPFFAQIEVDGAIVNILNPDIGFDCSVTISEHHHGMDYWFPFLTASVQNGQVIVATGDDGPGFQWSFTAEQLCGLRPGTYRFGIKTTTNGQVTDLVDGSIAVIEGN